MATEATIPPAEDKAAESSSSGTASVPAQKPAIHFFFKKTSEKKLDMKMEAEARQRARATTPTSIPDEEQPGPTKSKAKRVRKRRSDSGPSKGSRNPKAVSPVPPTSSPGFLLQSTRTEIDPVTAAAPPAPPTPSSSPPPLLNMELPEAEAEVDLNSTRRKRQKKTPPCASVRVELDPETGMILDTPERTRRRSGGSKQQPTNRLVARLEKTGGDGTAKAMLIIKACGELDPVVLLPQSQAAPSSPVLPSGFPEYDASSEGSAAGRPPRKLRTTYSHKGTSLVFSIMSSSPPREPAPRDAFAILGKKKPEPVAKVLAVSVNEIPSEKDDTRKGKAKRKRTKKVGTDTPTKPPSFETPEAPATLNDSAPATTMPDVKAPPTDPPPAIPPVPAKPEVPKVTKVVHPFFSAAGRKKMAQTAVVTESANEGEAEPEKAIAINSDPNNRPAARSTGSSPWSVFGKATPFSGSLSNHAQKMPGMLEPPWPVKGTAHVRGLPDAAPYCVKFESQPFSKDRKLKDQALVTAAENLLCKLSLQLDIAGVHKEVKSEGYADRKYLHVEPEVTIPRRVIMSGTQLQERIRSRISARLPHPKAIMQMQETDADSDSGAEMMLERMKVHPALLRLYSRIGSELSPFDKNECETIPWKDKYAPTSPCEVLQSTRETDVLTSWLLGLRTDRVDIPHGKGKAKRGPTGRPGVVKKKRKKKEDGLDGFIITSEEEEDMMSEITDPEEEEDWTSLSSGLRPKKSIIRAGDKRQEVDFFGRPAELSKKMNAILISGPNGCGKTAAVYAVAKDLGYVVFEISPGTKRSGKDVVDQVGDMSRNHLVHQSKQISTEQDNPFAKAKTAAPSSPTPSTDEDPQKRQQQSLILLEEVDILFEEDKTFWPSIISLMSKSKRPIIMTCNDESLLPLDTLSLHAILRFSEPSPDLLADHLLLICANEGHLIERPAIDALVKTTNNDIRSSIMDLQLYCQIGIADRTGGLDWQLIQWPPITGLAPQDRHRVVSVDTYTEGMGWIDNSPDVKEEHRWQQVWEEYSIDIGATEFGIEEPIGEGKLDKTLSLKAMDEFFGARSAADAICGLCMACIDQPNLDVTYPPRSDTTKHDDQLGHAILQTDPFTLPGSIATELSIYTRILSRRLFIPPPITHHDLITTISNRHTHLQPPTTYQSLFLPLTKHEPLFASTAQTTISSVLPSLRPLATDVAPWVRTIVRHDIAVERERRRRSGLLSLGGKRKTRAARLALEGGSREKRERWLRGVGAEVLGSAGEAWGPVGDGSEGVESGDVDEVDEIMSED